MASGKTRKKITKSGSPPRPGDFREASLLNPESAQLEQALKESRSCAMELSEAGRRAEQLETLSYVMKKYNKGPILLVRTTASDPQYTADMARRLKEMYETHGIKVSASETQGANRATREWQFSIVTMMLLALSVTIALVGGIALMGALSIGVIERTKEIGVLRAVGARSHVILGIFGMEGILQGLMSWMIAVPISLLISPLAAQGLGKVMFGANLDYQYNWLDVFIWLAIVVVISILASILPARGATRISVRDSLAYG